MNLKDYVANVNNFTKELTLDTAKTARYFKVSFTAKNAYPVLKEIFPFLSAANRSAEYIDISSVGYGAVADNAALKISNIIYESFLFSYKYLRTMATFVYWKIVCVHINTLFLTAYNTYVPSKLY